MRLALKWPDNLREKLRLSTQLSKEPSFKVQIQNHVSYKIISKGFSDSFNTSNKTKNLPVFVSTEFTRTTLTKSGGPNT